MRNEVAAKVYLAALWVVCVYRAATQSIVHDEALTYQLYLAGPASQMFQMFDANHHFLNTLLMYLSVSLFGVSEFAMRIPALAGAALYFAAVYRISRYAFGGGLPFLTAIALTTLNPFILDFMVAARGYGMALALWMWALALLLPLIAEPKTRSRRALSEAGVALALSVVANLVFVLPAALLGGMSMWLLRKRGDPQPDKQARKKLKRRGAEEPSVAIYFALPVGAIAVLFLMISPLASATSDAFYVGVTSIAESLRSLAEVSIAHGSPWRNSPATGWARDAIAFVVAPAILLAGFALGLRRRNTLLLLGPGAAIGSALLLLLAHVLLQAPYPTNRTGIYFLPVVSLTLIGLAASIPNKAAAMAGYALAGILIVQFAAEWNVRKFLTWEYDADTREIAHRVSERATGKGANTVRLGCTWQLEPALNFYRAKNAWTWMQPVTRAPLTEAFDYYALTEFDRPLVSALGLKVLYQGPVSGSVLAVRP
jgi:uncharacterized membrane protein